jgi:uncharacterized membrane protein (UPF0136 family)
VPERVVAIEGDEIEGSSGHGFSHTLGSRHRFSRARMYSILILLMFLLAGGVIGYRRGRSDLAQWLVLAATIAAGAVFIIALWVVTHNPHDSGGTLPHYHARLSLSAPVHLVFESVVFGLAMVWPIVFGVLIGSGCWFLRQKRAGLRLGLCVVTSLCAFAAWCWSLLIDIQ